MEIHFSFWWSFLQLSILFCLIQQGLPLGCISTLCDGNPKNDLRPCPDSDKTCGNYGGKRHGARLLNAVDVSCPPGNVVFAPFNGTIHWHSPFGDDSCADKGVRIEGEGQWQGYVATMSFVEPYKTGGRVVKGEKIGRAVALACIVEGSFRPHVQFQLHREGRVIDPTNHIRDCMCTGQICETNYRNTLVEGTGYTTHVDFGRGFSIKCPDTKPPVGSNVALDDARPLIFSPIDGSRLGRLRVKEQRNGYDCENDGVFILGAEPWQEYEVRIYNVEFLDTDHIGLGQRSIRQGDPIARRLKCPLTNIDSVFVETRYRGRHVNMTELISGNNCKQRFANRR